MPGISTHKKNTQLYLQMKGVHSLLRGTLSVVEGMVALPIFYNRKSEYTSAVAKRKTWKPDPSGFEFPAVSFVLPVDDETHRLYITRSI